MGIPGESLNGVLSANELLTRANLMRARDFPNFDTPLQPGKRVTVIGRAIPPWTRCAFDALGAEKVMCVYRRSKAEAPARVEEVHTRRRRHRLQLAHQPHRAAGDASNKVRAMRCIRMELGEPDSSGRRKPCRCPAASSRSRRTWSSSPSAPTRTPSSADLQAQAQQVGYIETDDTLATSIAGVYAGGDIVTGAATVIRHGRGRKAARGMKAWLGLRTAAASTPPTAKTRPYGASASRRGTHFARVRLL